jgi:hypothetical protein
LRREGVSKPTAVVTREVFSPEIWRVIRYAAALRLSFHRPGILDAPPEPIIERRAAPTRWRGMTGGVKPLKSKKRRFGIEGISR